MNATPRSWFIGLESQSIGAARASGAPKVADAIETIKSAERHALISILLYFLLKYSSIWAFKKIDHF
jgi:hypothetical protein